MPSITLTLPQLLFALCTAILCLNVWLSAEMGRHPQSAISMKVLSRSLLCEAALVAWTLLAVPFLVSKAQWYTYVLAHIVYCLLLFACSIEAVANWTRPESVTKTLGMCSGVVIFLHAVAEKYVPIPVDQMQSDVVWARIFLIAYGMSFMNSASYWLIPMMRQNHILRSESKQGVGVAWILLGTALTRIIYFSIFTLPAGVTCSISELVIKALAIRSIRRRH